MYFSTKRILLVATVALSACVTVPGTESSSLATTKQDQEAGRLISGGSSDRSTDPSTMDGSPAPPNTPSCTGRWCGGHVDR